MDPLVDETDQPYAYAGDDPVNALDPSGLGLIPSWVSSGISSVGHGVIGVGECLESFGCFSPQGLANAGAGFADQAAQLLDGVICTGTSEQTCPTWSVGAPFACGPQGSYQVGEAAFFGLGFAFPGGDEADVGSDAASADSQAAARAEAQSISDILEPGGSTIGKEGTDPSIRELTGDVSEAQAMFAQLGQGGQVVESTPYLIRVELPDGGVVQLRTVMSASPNSAATIDINVPGIGITKLKFNP